jgi:hypothetical protein
MSRPHLTDRVPELVRSVFGQHPRVATAILVGSRGKGTRMKTPPRPRYELGPVDPPALSCAARADPRGGVGNVRHSVEDVGSGGWLACYRHFRNGS